MIIASFISCNNDNISTLSENERLSLAEKYYQKGESLYPQGSPNSMLWLEKAMEMNPNHSYAQRELSVAYLKRGLPHKWKEQFDKAVKIDPESWQGWRGYLYLQFYRDYDKALTNFNATDSITPHFVDIIQGQSVDYWRGITYLAKKDYDNAIDYFNKYINFEAEKLGEDWVETTAYLYRGITYLNLDKNDKALEDFNKTLKYSQNKSSDAKFYKAQVLNNQGKKTEALKIINSAIQDYDQGYKNSNPYTEVQHEIYKIDLETLKKIILENKTVEAS